MTDDEPKCRPCADRPPLRADRTRRVYVSRSNVRWVREHEADLPCIIVEQGGVQRFVRRVELPGGIVMHQATGETPAVWIEVPEDVPMAVNDETLAPEEPEEPIEDPKPETPAVTEGLSGRARRHYGIEDS